MHCSDSLLMTVDVESERLLASEFHGIKDLCSKSSQNC